MKSKITLEGWHFRCHRAGWEKVSHIEDTMKTGSGLVIPERTTARERMQVELHGHDVIPHDVQDMIVENAVRCDLNGGLKLSDAIGSTWDDDDPLAAVLEPMCFFKNNNMRAHNPRSLGHSAAQAVLISIEHESYVFFSMTTYGFWSGITLWLKKTFGVMNLGGSLVKIGSFSEIDEKLMHV